MCPSVAKEAAHESNGDEGSGGSCEQQRRKLRIATTMVVEAASDDVMGGGSFKCVHRWRKKLRSSYDNGRSCTRKLWQ